MQTSNHRTIEVSPALIFSVRGQIHSNVLRGIHQELIRDAHPLQAARGCQVEAQAQIDDGTNNKRLESTHFSAPGNLLGPLQTPHWIGLPEVNTGAKPIVIIVTRLERLSIQQTFSNGAVTTVVAKDE